MMTITGKEKCAKMDADYEKRSDLALMTLLVTYSVPGALCCRGSINPF